MIYELATVRRHSRKPGRSEQPVRRPTWLGFFDKYGIGILGFWTEEIGTSNRLTFILSYDDMGRP